MRKVYLSSGWMVLLFFLLGCAAETADIEYGVLGRQHEDSDCVIVSSQHRAYYFGVNSCLRNNELKQALHNRIKDHQVIPYLQNNSSFPAYFTKNYITLGNFAEVVPFRFDAWDAFVVFATKGANPLAGCSAGRLYDYYDGQCYNTPTEIMSVSSGGDQDSSSGGNTYNREHSWPKSWFQPVIASGYCQSRSNLTNTSTIYDYRAHNDLHHLLPARASVNTARSNYSFGRVLTDDAGFPSNNGSRFGVPDTANMANFVAGSATTKVFEPTDDLKGDIARVYFYMATRYYTEDDCWNTNSAVEKATLRLWLETVLRDWHEADPVSDGERARNDWIHRIQGNRNPFIDHPEWVSQISDF